MPAPCTSPRYSFCLTQLIVDHLILATALAYLVWEAEYVDPAARGFSLDDPAINVPYKTSSLHDMPLYIGSFLFGALLFTLTEFSQRRTHQSFMSTGYAAYRTLVIYLVGWITSGLVGEVLKSTTGRVRPHFLSLCGPEVTKQNAQGLVLEYTCGALSSAEDPYRLSRQLREAFRSFPSGHANVAAYMALFSVVYIHYRWHIRWSLVFKPVVQLVLITIGLKIGIDRVMEHQHHTDDVIVGYFIGFTAALAVLYGTRDVLLQQDPPTSTSNMTSQNGISPSKKRK